MDQSPSLVFRDSLAEVGQLIAMHAALTGTGPGRRHNVEILNKSAVIFACAAFEAFVEVLVSESFSHLVKSAPDHTGLPNSVLRAIATSLREDPHELRVWELAGDGWKSVADSYRKRLIRKYIGPFNTPKPGNIDELVKRLIGLDQLFSKLSWQGMPASSTKSNLVDFVELRGLLAHGNRPGRSVTKKAVTGYLDFLAPLSVRMSNVIRDYCHGIAGTHPWPTVSFGRVR